MANDLLGIGVTGLRVSQSALSTVGHNIANADTEGYSRQRIEPVTNPEFLSSGSYVGSGVRVDAIERIVNGFVTEQLRTDTTLFQGLDSFYNHVRQLDNLLSDESTGLSGSLNEFSAALQNGANDPTSIPARQLIISQSENLADRFNSIYERLQIIGEGVDDAMEVAVEQINALASNIAQLNVKISNALGTSGGASPNDLLDQRDRALRELAGLVNIQVFDQGNGQVNVSVGTGQALVIGKDANGFVLEQSDDNPNEYAVMFKSGNQRQDVTASIAGGELGGLIKFRDEVLDSVFNDLGRIAVVMADSFNTVNRQGIDLDGQFGGLFFYDINAENIARDRVIPNSDNPNADSQVMALFVRDSSELSTSDYTMSIAGGGVYTITRKEDGVQVSSGLIPGNLPFSVEFDGLELEIEKGSYQAGDSFLLQPVRGGAQEFKSTINNPEDIAFASPLVTDASLGNLGSGKISSGEVVTLFADDGSPLPLFNVEGEMSPPLVVKFTSPYTYDILDNSDPGNPVQLEPPIRDQRYIPGSSNLLFSTDPKGTQVTTAGDMIGLPDGRSEVTQASLQAATNTPDFGITDFSSTANQFAFDVVISDTLNGNNGTYTVTINGAAIIDESALITQINAQLASSGAQAYLDDSGQLAFRMNSAGYGDISIQNYDADPDGNGDAAGAGLATNLLGIDIENFTYTTAGNADGVSGDGALSNGYPAELITIKRPGSSAGVAGSSTNVTIPLNASAKQIASELSNVPGVEANAFNYIELSDLQVSNVAPVQIQLNGESLIRYGSEAGAAPVMPDPAADPEAFYQYLAESINENDALKASGIYAVAGVDSITGEPELRVYGSQGDDLSVSLTAAQGESIAVSDGEHGPVNLNGAGNSVTSSVVVGGRLDVSLSEGVTLSSFPPVSMLFGDTQAADFAQQTYMGIQASITGNPQAGDVFTLDFNSDAAMDNRNALNFANLIDSKSIDGVNSFSQAYGNLVQKVGIETNSAKTNRDAAEQVMQQTEDLRNSISGVNLDEEAADLIRFEQMFSANAQVISVARDIFDRLISAF